MEKNSLWNYCTPYIYKSAYVDNYVTIPNCLPTQFQHILTIMHIYYIYACYKNILTGCLFHASATNNWRISSLLIPLQIEAKSLSNYEAVLVTQFPKQKSILPSFLLLPVLFPVYQVIYLLFASLYYIHSVFMSFPSRQAASNESTVQAHYM